MKFRYWTIRLRPFPMSLTTLGAGVIVSDPAYSRAEVKFLPRDSQLLTLGSVGSTARGLLDSLKDRIDILNAHQTTLEVEGELHLGDMLSALSSDWNNAVIIDSPRVMAADSMEHATKILFQTYIGETERPPKIRNITRVRRTVSEAYGTHPSIVDHLFEHPVLETSGLEEELDFAVVGEGSVFEINSAFNFATSSLKSAQHKAEAWTWRIDRLRRQGGELIHGDSTIGRVGRESPVVAMIYPPETDRQKENFFNSTSLWEDLGIEAVNYWEIERHADVLAERIPA